MFCINNRVELVKNNSDDQITKIGVQYRVSNECPSKLDGRSVFHARLQYCDSDRVKKKYAVAQVTYVPELTEGLAISSPTALKTVSSLLHNITLKHVSTKLTNIFNTKTTSSSFYIVRIIHIVKLNCILCNTKKDLTSQKVCWKHIN